MKNNTDKIVSPFKWFLNRDRHTNTHRRREEKKRTYNRNYVHMSKQKIYLFFFWFLLERLTTIKLEISFCGSSFIYQNEFSLCRTRSRKSSDISPNSTDFSSWMSYEIDVVQCNCLAGYACIHPFDFGFSDAHTCVVAAAWHSPFNFVGCLLMRSFAGPDLPSNVLLNYR